MELLVIYNEIVKKLNSKSKFAIKLGLERIQKLLFFLKNPEKKIKCIHVTGTNGKGSICTMFSSIFSHNGYKTGLFISPYVTDLRESFQINGKKIPKPKFVKIFQKISTFFDFFEKIKDPLSNFEILTAIAFEYFYRENCDIAIIEAGLGGTFDSTNVIERSLMSVISTISLDHTKFLGDTPEKIAFDKCGIIKKDCPVIVHPNQKSSVNKIILECSEKLGSKVIFADTKKFFILSSNLVDKTTFSYENKKFILPLLGEHQIENVATVFAGLKILNKRFDLSYQGIFDGLKNVNCPARLEILQEPQLIILDGAHNFQSITALAEFFKKYLSEYDLIGIFGMMADKEVEKCLQRILPIFKLVFPVAINDCDRAMSLENLTEIAKKIHKNVFAYKELNDALKIAINKTKKAINKEAIIIFGSFYLGHTVLKMLGK